MRIIYTISLKALFQPEIFSRKKASLFIDVDKSEILNNKNTSSENYKNIFSKMTDVSSGQSVLLTSKDLEEHAQKLIRFIEKEKPYLNGELKLQDLSNELNLSRNELSYIINSKFRKNFYHLINEYRIKDVKERIKDPVNKNLTLVAIAFASGFNSKATFNRAFKNITNMTPSEYLGDVVNQVNS